MDTPTGILCVIPSRLRAGEEFPIKIKVLGPVRPIPAAGQFCTVKPALHGPYNLNVQRQIQYHDNCLPLWAGSLFIDGGAALDGPGTVEFDGSAQGTFAGDTRPIGSFAGFSITEPGFHFIRVTDPVSGVEAFSNPVYVTAEEPAYRVYWGDPHWQTFFSDGIRCPEELYAFARDEGFLDFGAISDHMEAITDRQWDYFKAVANDFNEPGRFVTLLGQEWTHHDRRFGAPGHRNIYYRGNDGPVLRSTDPGSNTLEKLWQCLDALPAGMEALAIPHHSANKVMGVDWDNGWHEKYERAVEMFSVWGSSERHAEDGNPLPIRSSGGEVRGRHVVDALNRGYRFGFVGGGDIHDGRPGDALHTESYRAGADPQYCSGFTAVRVPALTREAVFDAIRDRRTYAATQDRIFVESEVRGGHLHVRAASQHGLKRVTICVDGADACILQPGDDARVLEQDAVLPDMKDGGYRYVRVETNAGTMAWESPEWKNPV